jgi:hypothetical protein
MTETQGLVKDCARLCDSHVRLRGYFSDNNPSGYKVELALLKEYGFSENVFLGDVSTLFGDDDYLFASIENTAYIAFLGTESAIGEWFLNAAVSKTPWYSLDKNLSEVMVHAGFSWGWYRIYDQIKDLAQFRALYEDFEEVVICGHSRGGAIAQLAYPYLLSKFNVKKIITFGAPKVGDESFVCYNEEVRTPTLHVRNWLDPVPHLPIGGGFKHYGDVKRIGIWGHRMKLYNKHRMKLYNKWRGKI